MRPDGGFTLGPFKTTITIKRPRFIDRVAFAWDHFRCCGPRIALAIMRRKATAVRHPADDWCTGPIFFLNYGYRSHRKFNPFVELGRRREK